MTLEAVLALPTYSLSEKSDTPYHVKFIDQGTRNLLCGRKLTFPRVMGIYERQTRTGWKIYKVTVVKRRDDRVLI